MSMEKLVDEVKECIEREYGRAGAKYGLTHNSEHESYAILLEEMEEAEDELKLCKSALEKYWNQVKTDLKVDKFKLDSLNVVYSRALLGACELIQVAAMAKKASLTICDKNAIKEFKGE